MTHYKRDTVAQLNRDIEYGRINPQVGDTLEALGFGTEGDGGHATYKIMKDVRAEYWDMKLADSSVAVMQPVKQPKKKRKLGGRP